MYSLFILMLLNKKYLIVYFVSYGYLLEEHNISKLIIFLLHIFLFSYLSVYQIFNLSPFIPSVRVLFLEQKI